MAAAATKIQAPLCYHCHQDAGRQKCGKCQLIRYCSRDCQRSAHAIHKLVCRPNGAEEGEYTQCDAKGLAAVHYAKIYHQEEAIPASKYPLFKTALSGQGATANDLGALTDTSVDKLGMTPVLFEDREEPLSQEEYYALSKTHYKSGLTMLPDELVRYYGNPLKPILVSTDLSLGRPEDVPVIQKFEEAPPKVRIGKESPQMGMGLIADEDIPAGDVICGFGGTFTYHPKKTFQANMNELGFHAPGDEGSTLKYDLSTFSAPARFANDNPINSVLAHIHKAGLPPIPALRALKEIKKGEFINWNYALDHFIKGKIYALTDAGLARISTFCTEKFQSPQHLKQMLILFSKNPRTLTLQESFDLNMMLYLLATPTVLFKLHLMGILDPRLTKAFLTHKDFPSKHLENAFAVPLNYFPRILDKLCKNENMNPGMKGTLLAASDTLSSLGFCETLNTLSLNPDPLSNSLIPHVIEREKIYEELLSLMNEDAVYREEEKEDTFDIVPLLLRYSTFPAPIKELSVITNRLIRLQETALENGKHARAAQLQKIIDAFEAIECGKPLQRFLRPNAGLSNLKANLD